MLRGYSGSWLVRIHQEQIMMKQCILATVLRLWLTLQWSHNTIYLHCREAFGPFPHNCWKQSKQLQYRWNYSVSFKKQSTIFGKENPVYVGTDDQQATQPRGSNMAWSWYLSILGITHPVWVPSAKMLAVHAVFKILSLCDLSWVNLCLS